MPRLRGVALPFIFLATFTYHVWCYNLSNSSAMPEVFHEARTHRRFSPHRSSCWIGREVSASFDQPIVSPARSLVTVCPSLRIQCRGRLTSWRTTMTVADRNAINFAIFRATDDRSGQRFTMVGYNTFPANTLGRMVFDVPRSKQLFVEPGDIFGYFRMGSGQPEFMGYVGIHPKPHYHHESSSTHSSEHGSHLTGSYDSCYQLKMTYVDLIKANYKITIDKSAVLFRRLYSLAAVIDTFNNTNLKAGPSKQVRVPRRRKSHSEVTPKRFIRPKSSTPKLSQRAHRNQVKSRLPRPIGFPLQPWERPPSYRTTTPAGIPAPLKWLRAAWGPTTDSLNAYNYLQGHQLDQVPSYFSQLSIPFARALGPYNLKQNRSFPSIIPRQSRSSGESAGLAWCGAPPDIDNAYSYNEIIPQIRLPARSYACFSGYTPVGFKTVYCDPTTREWTPSTFQCIYTIVMEDPPSDPPTPTPDEGLTTCLFPPIIDNGYAIRQDDTTVVYRCYPGFLKIGLINQDSSTCDTRTNIWTEPRVKCVLGRGTVTIPLQPRTTARPMWTTRSNREVIVMPQIFSSPPQLQTLPTPDNDRMRPRPHIPFATVTIPLQPITMRPPPPPPPVPLQPDYPHPYKPSHWKPQPITMITFPPQRNTVFPPTPFPAPFPIPFPGSFPAPVPPPSPPPGGSLSNLILDCGLPPLIANGRFYQDPDPLYPAKSFIYECYDGYVMHGQPVIFCNPYYGRFTQLTAKCEPRGLEMETEIPTRQTTTPTTTTTTTTTQRPADPDCGTPPPILNAFTVTGGRQSTAVYLCLPGYAGVGVAEIQCVQPPLEIDPGRGPTWSYTDFKCEHKVTTTTVIPRPTTAEEEGHFHPFLIITAQRPRAKTTTTEATTAKRTTRLITWQPLLTFPPPLLPSNPEPPNPLLQPRINTSNVMLITPRTPNRVTHDSRDWQHVRTLQPTRGMPNFFPPVTGVRTTTTGPIAWMEPSVDEFGNSEGICQVFETCGDPPIVNHAVAEPSYSGRHSCPGDYVRFVCNQGFRLESLVSVVFCSQATYSWSPTLTPKCVNA